MLPLFAALCLVLTPLDSEVGVITHDGAVVAGTLAASQVEMTTTFGAATIDTDAIVSIAFGAEDVVTTRGDTVLRGSLTLPRIQLATANGPRTIARGELASLGASQLAPLTPGEVTNGVHWNGSTYHVRAPISFTQATPGKTWPALVILHGTSTNGSMYIRGITARWPEIAAKYILIGINGTIEGELSTRETPRYFFEWINFAGRSTHPVTPGLERQSPLLVAEVVSDLKRQLPIDVTFLCGHSMGGYMTYATYMNYPELFDGAMPVAGGMREYCQPSGYDDAKLIATQKSRPIAIVHATNDDVVEFEGAEAAMKLMREAGFTRFKLFSNDTGKHAFFLVPVPDALSWLESEVRMSGGG